MSSSSNLQWFLSMNHWPVKRPFFAFLNLVNEETYNQNSFYYPIFSVDVATGIRVNVMFGLGEPTGTVIKYHQQFIRMYSLLCL